MNLMMVGAGAVVANYPFSTVETNVGIAALPDPRLDKLQEMVSSPSSRLLGDTAEDSA